MTSNGPGTNGLDDENDLRCIVGFVIMIISIAIILLSVVLYAVYTNKMGSRRK